MSTSKNSSNRDFYFFILFIFFFSLTLLLLLLNKNLWHGLVVVVVVLVVVRFLKRQTGRDVLGRGQQLRSSSSSSCAQKTTRRFFFCILFLQKIVASSEKISLSLLFILSHFDFPADWDRNINIHKKQRKNGQRKETTPKYHECFVVVVIIIWTSIFRINILGLMMSLFFVNVK